MSNGGYLDLLAAKAFRAEHIGLERVPELASHLFPFQNKCVEFMLRIGRGGLFLDTGLGKTACELEWCRHAAEETNGRALILTPLAVAQQIAREGARWDYDCRVIRNQSEAKDGINVCNYDRLEQLDPSAYGAVALDESSILKNFAGKTSRALIESFALTRFRMSATATPAPNDHMELGQHSAFCGAMASNEMLSRFFINDASTASQNWRLKGHAVDAFWDWMASWCRMGSMPSDLGDSNDGFILPELRVHHHRVESNVKAAPGALFASVQVSATEMHHVKRQTAKARAECAAEIAAEHPTDPWVIWCDTDYEADAIAGELNISSDVAEVRGSQSVDKKEETLAAFIDGSVRVLITKPSVCGFGLNWQHCAHTIFVGRSFSYEKWYQAIRRLWRFGQARNVECHVIVATGEESIGRVIDRKADDHSNMKLQMKESMLRAMDTEHRAKVPYEANHEGVSPSWM